MVVKIASDDVDNVWRVNLDLVEAWVKRVSAGKLAVSIAVLWPSRHHTPSPILVAALSPTTSTILFDERCRAFVGHVHAAADDGGDLRSPCCRQS